MSKAWPDVKRMLDDPYVSADAKEQLLVSYLREQGRFHPGMGGGVRTDGLPEDVRGYVDRYKLTYDDYWGATSTDEAYGNAQRESEEKGHHDRQVSQQVQQKQGELNGVAPPSAGGRGVSTSDELFDIAKPALSVFERFVPIDAKVPGDTRTVNNPLDFNRDIQTRFDEQRGINFKKMLEEADRMAAAHASLSELKSTTESQLNSLYQSWTGPAANASYEHYTKQIDPNVTDLLPYLERGPQVIRTAVDTVFQACKAKADQVLKLYRQTVGAATPEIADKVMKLAKGEFSDQDEILPVAAWVDSVCGSNLEQRIREDDCGLNDGNKQYTIEQCKKWIRESFNVEFWGDNARMGMCLQFDKICKDTVEAVDGAWQTINDFFKPYQNEFPQADANAVQQPGTGTGTGTGSSGTGAGTGTGTGGSGTGTGGSGTGSPPPVPPPVPVPPPGGGTGGNGMGSGGVPSVPIPGTGTDPSLAGPGGTDPSLAGPGQGGVPGGDPSRPGGGGVPSVPIPGMGGGGLGGGPGTGLPGTPGLGGEPKTVSIKDGNRTITVGEPDAKGRSKITIDDGSGKPPKSFTMDFGEAMKTFGGDAPVPGIGEPGELDENLVKAGPDGKVVIEDGDTKITAERVPGEPDKIKLSVDDGTPPPSEYTVDFNTPGATPPGADSFVPSGSGIGDLDTPGAGGGSASGFGGGSGGGSGGGGAGGGGGGVPGAGGGAGAGASRDLDAGSATTTQTPGSSEQKTAAVGASASAGGGPGGQGGPMGGMPMGGMGAGAGQGGDQTRGGSKWRTTGQLFDDTDPAAHFSGIVGEDPGQKTPRPPKKG